MSIGAAEAIVMALGVYLGLGVLVAILFLALAAGRKDLAAKGASVLFRPMVFLGCVGLWPFLIGRLFGPAINHPHAEEGDAS